MKLYISAYAKQKRDMESMMSRKIDVIIEHLIKLICMPDSESRNHWEGEIAGQLNRLQKFKSSNKYPSVDSLMEWTYYSVLDDIQNIGWLKNEIANMEYDYSVSIDISPQQLSQKLDTVTKEYLTWLFNILVNDGYISNREIYHKLDSLL